MFKRGSGYELMGLITHIGLNMVLTVGVAAWAGHWLDTRLATGPYLTLVGAVIGIAAAYWNTYRLMESFFSSQEKGGRPNE